MKRTFVHELYFNIQKLWFRCQHFCSTSSRNKLSSLQTRFYESLRIGLSELIDVRVRIVPKCTLINVTPHPADNTLDITGLKWLDTWLLAAGSFLRALLSCTTVEDRLFEIWQPN